MNGKGLYQILAEDYREYQIKEPIRKQSKRLIESTRPSKLKRSLKENEEEIKIEEQPVVEEPVVEEQPAPVVEEPVVEPVPEVAEEVKPEGEIITESEEEIIKGSEEVEEPAEEVIPDEVEEDTPEEVLAKIAAVAGLSKEEIEKAMAELPEEELEAVKANFNAIKNTAMELFPEEVEEDIEEITEEIPEEIEEEPFEECEITSFKVTRIAPKVGAVMIEAQTKEGLKYITGKNFNESEKTLDEAEISVDKTAAANRFKGFLK